MFNSDPEDQEVDVTDLESPDDENEKNKPLEETFIVKQNVEKPAEKASTERSASQTWFKCGKTGPKCHKRFIHSDLEKHNQQYHSQEKEVDSVPKSTEEEMKEKAVEREALDEDSTTKPIEKDNKEESVEKEARVVPAAATTDEEFSVPEEPSPVITKQGKRRFVGVRMLSAAAIIGILFYAAITHGGEWLSSSLEKQISAALKIAGTEPDTR